jgi:hypothetical protein
MTANALEAKAHELLGRLGPGKLAAVVQLLEVMIHDDDREPVTEEDRRRYREGQAWFEQRGGKGIPMEDVLAEFGLRQDDFPLNR